MILKTIYQMYGFSLGSKSVLKFDVVNQMSIDSKFDFINQKSIDSNIYFVNQLLIESNLGVSKHSRFICWNAVTFQPFFCWKILVVKGCVIVSDGLTTSNSKNMFYTLHHFLQIFQYMCFGAGLRILAMIYTNIQ